MKPWTIVACAGLAVTLSSTPARAGDLNPPPGDIAPTMKPLDALLPGACLEDLPGDEGATRIISEPGLYILTQDLTGENAKDGIRVNCDAFPQGEHHVVIDLQGHTIRGVPGAANAILVNNSDPASRRVHVTVRGSLQDAFGNPTSLITGWSVDGVHVEGATSCTLQGVRVTDCLDDAFESTSPPALGTDVRCYTCVFERCGDDGVSVTLPASGPSSLEIHEVRCLSNANNGARVLYTGAPAPDVTSRARVRNSVFAYNTGNGLWISGIGDESISYSFSDDVFVSNGADGHRMSLDRSASRTMSVDFRRCSASGNAGNGYNLVVANDPTNSGNNINWEFCSASGNGISGFRCDTTLASPATAYTFVWDSCTALGNTSHGIHSTVPPTLSHQGRLLNCRASGNGGDGGRMESMDASVDLCVFSDNTGNGLSVINASLRCRDSSCRNNTLSGLLLSDTLRTRRTSIDLLRCADNGADGISATGLASLHVTSSSSSANGRGAGNGSGLLCADVDHFLCDSSSFQDNAAHGISSNGGGTIVVSGGTLLRNGTGPTGGDGLNVTLADSCRVSSTTASDNTRSGISCADLNRDGRLDVVTCVGNGAHGASFTNCPRLRADSCDFSSNTLHGMRVSGGGSIQVSGATFRANMNDGLNADGLDDIVLTDSCTASQNGANGIHVADLNGDGRLDLVTCNNNGGSGILFDSPLGLACGRALLTRCVTSSNSASGVDLNCTTGGTIRRCEASNNAAFGFLVSGNNHVVIENVASSNPSGGFLVTTPGNTLGPLVDEVGAATNDNPAANYLR